jgi:hypothetical protein
LKLPQASIGKTLEDIYIGNCFLNKTPIAQEVRVRIDKWDCIELKSFTLKETITRTERKSLPAIH